MSSINFCALGGSDLYGVLAVNGWFGFCGIVVAVADCVVFMVDPKRDDVPVLVVVGAAAAAAEEGVAKLKVDVLVDAGAGAGVVAVDPNENDDAGAVVEASAVVVDAVVPPKLKPPPVVVVLVGAAAAGVDPNENPPPVDGAGAAGVAVEGAGVLPKLNAIIDKNLFLDLIYYCDFFLDANDGDGWIGWIG